MKYILGGGISGLIWSYYHPEYMIVADDVGGQMASKYVLGPRYLHKTKNSEEFLHSLGYFLKTKVIKVGYLDTDGNWIKEPDLKFRQQYFKKSRRKDNLEGFDPTVMNSGKTEFEVFNINCNDLVFNLFHIAGNKIIRGRAEKVDLNNKRIFIRKTDGSEISSYYEHLVSSINLRTFYRLANLDFSDRFKAYDMTYCLVNNDLFDMEDFDFVYDCRKSTPFHRMTKDEIGIVIDIFGEAGYYGCIERKVVKNSQIISEEKQPDFENVKLIGRYGTWNRSWKTEKVIDEAVNEQRNLE